MAKSFSIGKGGSGRGVANASISGGLHTLGKAAASRGVPNQSIEGGLPFVKGPVQKFGGGLATNWEVEDYVKSLYPDFEESDWLDRSDNSYWSDNGAGSWDTDHWKSETIGDKDELDLVVAGSWAPDFRPDRMRIDFTGPPMLNSELSNDTDIPVIPAADRASGHPAAAKFTDDEDFLYLHMEADEPFEVNAIDFIGEVAEAPPPDNFFDDSYWVPLFSWAVWDAANNEWDSVDAEPDESVALEPAGDWEVGYDPDNVHLTIDKLGGGSSTFDITFIFDNGDNVVLTDLTISNGVPYEMDLSSGGDTVGGLIIVNTGDVSTWSLTDIIFNNV